MGAAVECGYDRHLLKLIQNPGNLQFFYGTAYGRDLLLQMLFAIRRFVAGDQEIAAYIAQLRDFWEHADKGDFARSGPARKALIFLRKLHVCGLAQDTKQQDELSKFLLDAVKNSQGDFELALAKAKQFRAKRGWQAFSTEVGDLRANLVFYGFLQKFSPEDFREDSEALMEKFDPGRYATLQAALKREEKDRAHNIKRKWRGVLRECMVRWERRRGGRPKNRVPPGTQKVPI
jgi:hypothetical protein